MRGATMLSGRRNDGPDVQLAVLLRIGVEQVEDIDKRCDATAFRKSEALLDAQIEDRDVVHPARIDRLGQNPNAAVVEKIQASTNVRPKG